MAEWIDIIWSDLASQFLNPKKRLFLGYLLSASLIATIWLCLVKRQSVGAAISTFLDRKVWLSRSSRHDLLSFAINRVIFFWLRPVLVTQLAIATLVFELLHRQDLVALGIFQGAGYWTAALSFTLFFFCSTDFTRFAVHCTAPDSTLWDFHKFYHSAETLTPLTVTRTHPVEGLVFTARSALVQGVLDRRFRVPVRQSGRSSDHLRRQHIRCDLSRPRLNLRHSHIAIRYPRPVERLLMSPAQHQLHHSECEQHHDRNFGVALSVWDRIFGSFHHSVSEPLSFGIGRETARFTGSIWTMYWFPLKSLARRVGGSIGPGSKKTGNGGTGCSPTFN